MSEPNVYEDEPCWCMGECCSDIPLTQADVDRISDLTNMRFDEFAVRTNAGMFMKRGEPIYEYRGEGLERMRYELRFCFFLNTETRLCRFYNSRANICRDFEHRRGDGQGVSPPPKRVTPTG